MPGVHPLWEAALHIREKTLFFLRLQSQGEEGEQETCGC